MRKDFYQVYEEYFAEPVIMTPAVETPVETFKPSVEQPKQEQPIVEAEIEVAPMIQVQEDIQDGDGADCESTDE